MDKNNLNDISIPILSYGILRCKGFLLQLLNDYNLDAVDIHPATIKGYVPYYSGSINMVFPVTDKQKDKYPEADFIIKGSLLYFKGSDENLKNLYSYIDRLEGSYDKKVVTTQEGVKAYLYYMDNKLKKYFNIYDMGLIIYKDSVLDRRYFILEEEAKDYIIHDGVKLTREDLGYDDETCLTEYGEEEL